MGSLVTFLKGCDYKFRNVIYDLISMQLLMTNPNACSWNKKENIFILC